MRSGLIPSLLLFAGSVLCFPVSAEQAPAPASVDPMEAGLYQTVLGLDRALFDAYNACELETFQKYLDENLEFYQDNDDPTTTRAALEPTFRDHCTPGNVAHLRRQLVPGSVEVHPIQGYGAVQFGTHRFVLVQPGKPDEVVATPRFVHLWHNLDGAWRITRVISYGH